MKKNQEQLQELFLEHYAANADGIFRFCYFKTSDREISLDITQEVFTKTWDYLGSGNTIENFKAFLYRTARNTVIDYHRKKKTQSLDYLLEEGFDVADTTSPKTQDVLDAKRIVSLLEDLDEKYKEILTLRYVQDLSIKEIALSINETENTVSVRIHRGLNQLQTLAEKYNE